MRTILLLTSLTLVTACEPDEPAQYTYQLRLGEALAGPMPLLIDGREVGEVRGAGELEVTIPKDQWISSASLTTTSQTSCGEASATFEAPLTRSREENARQDARSKPEGFQEVRATLQPPAPAGPTEVLYVDNRDGTATARIQVGSVEVTVPAGEAARRSVVIGDCAEGRAIQIDGEAVGTLPVLPARSAHLVDVVGGHCYERREIVYAEAGSAPVGGPPERERLAAARVQTIELLMYFLEEPDEEITSIDLAEQRDQLLHVPCN